MREQGGAVPNSPGSREIPDSGATKGRLSNRPSDLQASKFLLRVSLSLGGWKTLGLLVYSSQSACPMVPLLPSQDKGTNCDRLGKCLFLVPASQWRWVISRWAPPNLGSPRVPLANS